MSACHFAWAEISPFYETHSLASCVPREGVELGALGGDGNESHGEDEVENADAEDSDGKDNDEDEEDEEEDGDDEDDDEEEEEEQEEDEGTVLGPATPRHVPAPEVRQPAAATPPHVPPRRNADRSARPLNSFSELGAPRHRPGEKSTPRQQKLTKQDRKRQKRRRNSAAYQKAKAARTERKLAHCMLARDALQAALGSYMTNGPVALKAIYEGPMVNGPKERQLVLRAHATLHLMELHLQTKYTRLGWAHKTAAEAHFGASPALVALWGREFLRVAEPTGPSDPSALVPQARANWPLRRGREQRGRGAP